LSIVESLVVLVVSSLLLSVLLPTAIQSMSSNLRTGEEGLRQMRRSLDERAFRRILNAAAPARQAPGGRPVRLALRGDAARMSLSVLPREAIPCASAHREGTVTLTIIANESGAGGRLICANESVPGARTADSAFEAHLVTSWGSGVGAFAYSQDGVEWRSDWPDPEVFQREESAILRATDQSGVTQPLVLAPLVRFEVAGARARTLWVERAGAIEPVAVRADNEFLVLQSSPP